MGDFWRYITTASHWSGSSGIGQRLINHLWLSLLSVLIAGVLAIPIAVILGHRGGSHHAVVSIINIGRAVPSFALLALVLPLSIAWGFGLGFWPTAFAMVALAIPPMFVNALTGMSEVPADAKNAALGLGMRPREQIRLVELPLALPLILIGVRVATLQVIATATLGALVAFSGLGSLIEEGRASFDNGKTWTGSLLVIAAALMSQAALLVLERRATRWRAS